jgi:hypothetical protein
MVLGIKGIKNLTGKRQLISIQQGVVIKPIWEGRRPWNVAPCMKVRNERYLTLIYGYDYKSSVKYPKYKGEGG